MSPATALDDYKQRIASLDPSDVIGSIMWFTVNRPHVTLEQMREWFIDLGLDESYLPNEVLPVDAFRSVTGDQSPVKRPDYELPDGLKAKLRWEDAGYDQERVERHLFRVTRDTKKREVAHHRIGEAIFYRQGRSAKRKGQGGEKVRFTVQWNDLKSDREKEVAEAYIQRTHDEYTLLCKYPTANAARATVRNYILSLNSIAVRPSGGVYFVHTSRQDTVDKLQEFVRRFENGSTLHTLPLVDTGEQREMLADSFQDEVQAKVDKLLEDVAKLNKRYSKGKVPPGEYAKANAEYQELINRTKEYTDILQLSMGSAGMALEVALDSVMDLATRIDHSK